MTISIFGEKFVTMRITSSWATLDTTGKSKWRRIRGYCLPDKVLKPRLGTLKQEILFPTSPGLNPLQIGTVAWLRSLHWESKKPHYHLKKIKSKTIVNRFMETWCKSILWPSWSHAQWLTFHKLSSIKPISLWFLRNEKKRRNTITKGGVLLTWSLPVTNWRRE